MIVLYVLVEISGSKILSKLCLISSIFLSSKELICSFNSPCFKCSSANVGNPTDKTMTRL